MQSVADFNTLELGTTFGAWAQAGTTLQAISKATASLVEAQASNLLRSLDSKHAILNEVISAQVVNEGPKI
jgi:hypothetical protein